MSVRTALLAASVVLLASLALAPASADPLPVADNECLDAADMPPCGYIVPTLSLEFPDKPTCRAQSLGAAIDLTACIPLPADGGSHVEEGVLRMSWDITQDGTYPADPLCLAPTIAVPPALGTCITITFSGTATNPAWMQVLVEPGEVHLTQVDLLTSVRVDPETQQVWFWYEVPLKVTFTRDGSPDEASLAKIERAQGVTQVFLRAKSSASGAYFKEAFGVEEFRFNSCSEEAGLRGQLEACGGEAGSKDAPAPGLLALLGTLALVVVALRRRA